MRNVCNSGVASYHKLIQTISGFSRIFQFGESNGFPCYSIEGVEKRDDFESLKVRKRAGGSWLVDVEALKLAPKHVACVVPGRNFSVRVFPNCRCPSDCCGKRIWKEPSYTKCGDDCTHIHGG